MHFGAESLFAAPLSQDSWESHYAHRHSSASCMTSGRRCGTTSLLATHRRRTARRVHDAIAALWKSARGRATGIRRDVAVRRTIVALLARIDRAVAACRLTCVARAVLVGIRLVRICDIGTVVDGVSHTVAVLIRRTEGRARASGQLGHKVLAALWPRADAAHLRVAGSGDHDVSRAIHWRSLGPFRRSRLDLCRCAKPLNHPRG